MIGFEAVGVTWSGAPAPVLSGVDLQVPEGELCLVVGPTGSGKSTLLRCVNGLVPHFTGGRLDGRVTVAGRDTRTHPPRELADVVGVVLQDPLAGFVTDVVEDELAYGMESLGLAPALMRRRVEETLDLLGLAPLRDRPLLSLSGGERQRVAIGSVLTPSPKVLVLDEPTSALDPPAAEEVLAALTRLVHDLGLTVLLAEHRLERVVQHADRVVLVPGGGAPLIVGAPGEVLAASPSAPPVVELARLVGWQPVPLSVRDARRLAGPVRERLARSARRDEPGGTVLHGPGTRSGATVPGDPGTTVLSGPGARPGATVPDPDTRLATRPSTRAGTSGPAAVRVRLPADLPVAHVDRLTVRYDDLVALDRVTLQVDRGEVVAVMGRNGAGKSTLLCALVGLVRPAAGTVRVRGRDPAVKGGVEMLRDVGLVPQEPGDLLYADTVAGECRDADRDARLADGTTAAVLARLLPAPASDPTGTLARQHPRDLSEGQRLALALAVVLAAEPALLLLDEPTRGLDPQAKRRLVRALRALAAGGTAVVLSTHDVELAAEVSDRTVVLAEGEVVADGPTREVVVGSPAFAPQIAKVLAPLPYLTVAEVEAALC